MSIEELLRQHQEVAHVARRWGEEGLHLWYADLRVEVRDEQVSYLCPSCGTSQASTIHEFVYCECSHALLCGICRGDVEERAGALD